MTILLRFIAEKSDLAIPGRWEFVHTKSAAFVWMAVPLVHPETADRGNHADQKEINFFFSTTILLTAVTEALVSTLIRKRPHSALPLEVKIDVVPRFGTIQTQKKQ